jgi:hypothetical protein
MSRCAGITATGDRCKAEAMPEAQWCWNHHPDYEQARRRRASKGGKRGGRGRPGTSEIEQIKADIRATIDGVADGEIENGTTLFMGYNVLIRAFEVGRKAREADELERRIAQMEQRVYRGTG